MKVNISRWLGYGSAVLALALLGLNIYGSFKSLRSPDATQNPADFSHAKIIGSDEAWDRLARLDITDRRQFALQANEIIGQTMKHVNFNEIEKNDSAYYYRLTVPIWENYFLYIFKFLKPSTYEIYELSDYKRAIERGVGQCGQQSMALIGFLEEKGFNTGFVQLNGHVAATAEVAPGEWYVLDPDYGVSIPRSAEELASSRELVETYYSRFLHRNPWGMYGPEPLRVAYGGAGLRYPRGSVIEELAYAAKWAFPVVLFLFALWVLFGRMGKQAAPSKRIRTNGSLRAVAPGEPNSW